jgi:HSP20 family protein
VRDGGHEFFYAWNCFHVKGNSNTCADDEAAATGNSYGAAPYTQALRSEESAHANSAELSTPATIVAKKTIGTALALPVGSTFNVENRMSNITIRNKNGNDVATRPVVGEWEPFSMLRGMLRWDPFCDIAVPVWSADDREGLFLPKFEIKETKESFLFKADVPGVNEQDLDISVSGNQLTVKGKREAERHDHDDTYFACERSYGSFTRSFTLPNSVDTEHIRADIAHGVLTLAIAKKPEAQPKRIAIKSTEKLKP